MIKDNYRGISLIPVIGKIYEQVLLDWFDADVTLANKLHMCTQRIL
jgi:hypothetical protein